MLVYLAYFIKEIKLLSTILFCLLCALPFFHKNVKIVFFVGMELKGNTTLVLEELMKNCSRIL